MTRLQKHLFTTCIILLLAFSNTATAIARDQLLIVGSSTVFPFAQAVAEFYSIRTGKPLPELQSTGSGGGFQLFCQGTGEQFPDIVNASRRIKPSEFDLCKSQGVGEIIEIKIGYDGIVLANASSAHLFNLSLEDIYLALAAKIPDPSGQQRLVGNPYTNWKQIDPALPDQTIEVLGPPPTSGTRDALTELALEKVCRRTPWVNALKKHNKRQFREVCRTFRRDGYFIEAGENDGLIVKNLYSASSALGIFGYNFLARDREHLQGATIERIQPSGETIAAGSYPLARPLFFYVKKEHLAFFPEMEEYIKEFTAETTWGEAGYLAALGLVPMPAQERRDFRKQALTQEVMSIW